jgi:hypothetical protein
MNPPDPEAVKAATAIVAEATAHPPASAPPDHVLIAWDRCTEGPAEKAYAIVISGHRFSDKVYVRGSACDAGLMWLTLSDGKILATASASATASPKVAKEATEDELKDAERSAQKDAIFDAFRRIKPAFGGAK